MIRSVSFPPPVVICLCDRYARLDWLSVKDKVSSYQYHDCPARSPYGQTPDVWEPMAKPHWAFSTREVSCEGHHFGSLGSTPLTPHPPPPATATTFWTAANGTQDFGPLHTVPVNQQRLRSLMPGPNSTNFFKEPPLKITFAFIR